MRAVIATHGHCFDGFASAAVFSRLLQGLDGNSAEFEYLACGYGAGQRLLQESALTGDVNAILDYRYVPSSRLTWYFDHHRTAFANAEDHAQYQTQEGSGRFYFEPSYGSCTQLIYDIGLRLKALDAADQTLKDLVRWADIIDTARFASAAAATDRSDPVLRFTSVVEQHADDAFLSRWVPRLASQSLSELAQDPEIAQLYVPIAARHEQFASDVRATAQRMGRVVLVDLTSRSVDFVGKFTTYALFPDSVYSVVVAKLKHGYKLSIGYNPWCGRPLDVDISAICARYGGGGHPVVGGISLVDTHRRAAQQLAEHIALELNGHKQVGAFDLRESK